MSPDRSLNFHYAYHIAQGSAAITEKIKGSQQHHKMQHNDGKDSFLGSLLVLPVELWKEIAG